MNRNLLMHVYPLKCHQNWRRSVRHLKARWGQFTGRKIISVAIDEKTNSPADVRAEFGDDCPIEMFAVQNSELQETNSFLRLLEAIEPDRTSITLYCHAKGATHCDPRSASHRWCDAMAEACLDYPALIDCCLHEAAVCGAFRSRMPIGWPHPSPPYHFAGTWYWFRNDALFARDWRSISQTFWGVESYPGEKFTEEESRCLFFDGAETAHLYDPEFWRKSIDPGMANWRLALRAAGARREGT